jgi:lipoate-protein ligase A
MHSHPTVRLWAQSLMNGQFIDYSGDPLLDFSISNFLDRIAYKDPKSKDKLAKFANKRSTKMSDYERPINEIDFKRGEKP